MEPEQDLLRICFKAVRAVTRISFSRFLLTLILGLGWRFSLIAGYVFSIQAVSLVFDLSPKRLEEVQYSMPLEFGVTHYALAVLSLFLLASLLDVAFSSSRLKLERLLEIFLTNQFRSGNVDNLIEITRSRRSFAAQTVMRGFDLFYALSLILMSFLLILMLSAQLALILSVLTLVAALFLKVQNTKHGTKISSFDENKMPRHSRVQKLMRSAKVRGITTATAGVFLALLVLVIGNGYIANIGLVELAIVAFCTRFFVSFFSMLYINVNGISDTKKVVNEFASLI